MAPMEGDLVLVNDHFQSDLCSFLEGFLESGCLVSSGHLEAILVVGWLVGVQQWWSPGWLVELLQMEVGLQITCYAARVATRPTD